MSGLQSADVFVSSVRGDCFACLPSELDDGAQGSSDELSSDSPSRAFAVSDFIVIVTLSCNRAHVHAFWVLVPRTI